MITVRSGSDDVVWSENDGGDRAEQFIQEREDIEMDVKVMLGKHRIAESKRLGG